MNLQEMYLPQIERARHPLGAKIGNNTRIRKDGKELVVKLHATDIVRILPDGSIKLFMAGWNTVTTRQRLNEVSRRLGVSISTTKGIPYLYANGNWDQPIPFKDGVRIYPNGRIVGAGKASDTGKALKLKQRIRAYAKGYMEAFVAGKVPAPGAGDCFFCSMREVKSGKPLGDSGGTHGHIMEHIREKYYVPSMLANANDRAIFPLASVSQVMLWTLAAFWGEQNETAMKIRQNPYQVDGLRKNLIKWIEHSLRKAQ